MLSAEDRLKAQELVACIQFFNQQGWSPATSTNYSVRSQNPQAYLISRSGVDKSKFQLTDLIMINPQGEVLPAFQGSGIKSSAETEIHTELYQRFSEINCVLHTHSVLGTVLSQTQAKTGFLEFSNWEILKGLEGNSTHELSVRLPIVANSQEMKDIISEMQPYLNNHNKVHGFLIAGHGLYSWGKDIASAKRHIETFEFLFQCYEVMRRNQWPS